MYLSVVFVGIVMALLQFVVHRVNGDVWGAAYCPHLSGYYNCDSTSIWVQFDYDSTMMIVIKITI